MRSQSIEPPLAGGFFTQSTLAPIKRFAARSREGRAVQPAVRKPLKRFSECRQPKTALVFNQAARPVRERPARKAFAQQAAWAGNHDAIPTTWFPLDWLMKESEKLGMNGNLKRAFFFHDST